MNPARNELGQRLGLAARNDDVEQLYHLLCQGADLSEPVVATRQAARGFRHSATPRVALELALEGRASAAVAFLLRHGASPHAPLSDGRRPLHHAASQADMASALALVDAGASPYALPVPL